MTARGRLLYGLGEWRTGTHGATCLTITSWRAKALVQHAGPHTRHLAFS
jgi:hypothetical protein